MKQHTTLSSVLTLTFCIIHSSVVNAMIKDEELTCTRKCTMLDDTPDCWKQSLEFFTFQVQKSLRDYAALLIHINYWVEHLADDVKSKLSKDVTMIEEDALNRTLQLYNNLKEGQRAPLNEQDLRTIFEIVINKTRDHRSEYIDENILPVTVSCPVPCDYYPYLWSTLSYVLIACLVLCCLTFFLHTCYTSRKLDKHVKL